MKSYRSVPVRLLIATACPWHLQAESMRTCCCSELPCLCQPALLHGIGAAHCPQVRSKSLCTLQPKMHSHHAVCYRSVVKRLRTVAMQRNLVLVFIVSDLSRTVESLWRSFKGRGSYSKTEKGEESCSPLHGSTSMEAFCVNCIISLYISPCWDRILTGTKAQHKEADIA